MKWKKKHPPGTGWRFVNEARPYRVFTAATRKVLRRRACYGGRKGNSARRRLGFRPSTSAEAYRVFRILKQFAPHSREKRWRFTRIRGGTR